MRRFTDLLKRFRRDENGAFMVLFALLAIVLIAASGAVVDFTYTQTARSRAQSALDAAALALQSRIAIDNNATLISKAQTMMTERLNDASITATVKTAVVDTTLGKLDFTASVKVPTAFVQLVGIKSITAQLASEAVQGSKDVEVSVALDTTGSMAGTKISDLIDATNTLIDLVVQTTQTPTYSKMAIVPWAFGANAGSYAASVRGTPTPPSTITSATWMATTTVNIDAMTNANPAVITTSANHGLNDNDYVYVSGVYGMIKSGNSKIPNAIYKVKKVDATHVQLLNTSGNNIDSSTWSAYATSPSKAVITGCFNSTCQVKITTSSAHGQAAGDTVYIANATGMTAINGTHVATVGTVPTTTSYYLTDETVSTVAYNTYTASSASTYCTNYGCTFYYFTNASGGHNLYQVNNCTSERSGTEAFTDAGPSTQLLSFQYTSGGADCLTQTIQPLTTDKTVLHNLANSLTAGGSTAGHLGLAWGYYMISPNWASLWPTASRPAAYGQANLVKAVILMTDGDFNSPYCNGVIASDAGSGSGSASTHINCTSPNGDSQTQAQALCNQIKTQTNPPLLYTVGFDLGGSTTALNFLQGCATDPAHFYQADTGADLAGAFKAIASNLNSLRISK